MYILSIVYLVYTYIYIYYISRFHDSLPCYHVSFSAMSGYGFSTSVSFGSQRPHLTEFFDEVSSSGERIFVDFFSCQLSFVPGSFV